MHVVDFQQQQTGSGPGDAARPKPGAKAGFYSEGKEAQVDTGTERQAIFAF
jgi:hypothetical protein